MKTDLSPQRKMLTFGLIGFILGSCFAVVSAGWVLIQRTEDNLNLAYAATTSAQADPSTSTTTQPTFTPALSAYELEDLLEHIDYLITLDPEKTIQKIEYAMVEPLDSLVKASGYYYLAYAHLVMGNFDAMERNYQALLDELPNRLDTLPTIEQKSQAYQYLIKAAIWLDDYKTADQYYTELESMCQPVLQNPTEFRSLGACYTNILYTADLFGNFEEADNYFQDMQRDFYPLISTLSNGAEIGEAYTYLIEGAYSAYNLEAAEQYSQEMVDVLTTIRPELQTNAEKAKVNQILGDAALTNGDIQFAANYYNQVVEYDSSPGNVFMLAFSYTLAGNHECSYHWFQSLIQREQRDKVQLYTPIAEEVVNSVEELYGDNPIPLCP